MTEKIVRGHLRRIWFHWYRLQSALNDAQHAGVIDYPQDTPYKERCCQVNWELRKSVEKWSEKQISETIQASIRWEIS